MKAERLKEILSDYGLPVTACASISEGVENAIKQAGPTVSSARLVRYIFPAIYAKRLKS